MSLDLTVIVLTFNEEKHIARCIGSVRAVARRVVVIDSFSTDATVRLAEELGAEVFRNSWTDHATQLNWGLDNANIATTWIMRLDADEVVTPKLATELADSLPTIPDSVAGLTVNRRIYFLGKWIRHGGIYPAEILRIWRAGRGRCECRRMDEHLIVNGEIATFRGDIEDINLNNLTWWTNKHNQYASREATEMLMYQAVQSKDLTQHIMSRQANRKRRIKERLYSRLPLGLRAALYFSLRYFILLGFLDGWRGLAFHFLQGFWYRFLVDAKVFELQRIMREDRLTLRDAVSREWGYDIAAPDDVSTPRQ